MISPFFIVHNIYIIDIVLTLKSLQVKSTPRTNGNNPVFAMF